jgi:elongation factor G
MNTRLHTLRNLGIAAHVDAGKTTPTERILFHAGAIHTCGEVHSGNTTTDSSKIEKDKGITISSASVQFAWTQLGDGLRTALGSGQEHRVNLIDTPGHVDFTAEVERSLRVLDGAVAVFCAVAGVQPQSETVWRQMDRYAVPRLVFINKMDRAGADFWRVVREIREKLRANAAVILAPIGAEDDLLGQIDLIDQVALVKTSAGKLEAHPIPDHLREQAAGWHEELVLQLADVDEACAEVWLLGKPLPPALMRSALRRQTIAGRLIPVIGGSAYKYVGVEPLMDAVVDFLPSPLDLPAIKPVAGTIGGPEETAALAALAFKIVRHPQAGRITYVRVYAGRLEKGLTILNPRHQRTERVGRLLRVFANRWTEIDSAGPGEICAIAGMREFTTGDTLCLPQQSLMLEPPAFPDPVISMAVEATNRIDQNRLAEALARVSDEDPTFRVSTHPETGQCLISGMGELHMEVVRQKLQDDHQVETMVGAPQIAYRETIRTHAAVSHLLRKQNGGQGMYARVDLTVEPLPAGSGVQIRQAIAGGTIPTQFLNAVQRGIQDGLTSGPLDGAQVVDVAVTITDGDAHVKDSNEHAFRLAAAEATREALTAAHPVLLEPIMALECSTPDAHQGDIIGDLNQRRARITALRSDGHHAVVAAEVPLAEMFGYAGAIRSLSKGRASYSMTPSCYRAQVI